MISGSASKPPPQSLPTLPIFPNAGFHQCQLGRERSPLGDKEPGTYGVPRVLLDNPGRVVIPLWLPPMDSSMQQKPISPMGRTSQGSLDGCIGLTASLVLFPHKGIVAVVVAPKIELQTVAQNSAYRLSVVGQHFG